MNFNGIFMKRHRAMELRRQLRSQMEFGNEEKKQTVARRLTATQNPIPLIL